MEKIIQIGDKVTVDITYALNDKEIMEVKLVESQGDFFKHTVSISSPLGQCLLGKKVGDHLCYKTSQNTVELDILNILE